MWKNYTDKYIGWMLCFIGYSSWEKTWQLLIRTKNKLFFAVNKIVQLKYNFILSICFKIENQFMFYFDGQMYHLM